MLNRVRPSLFAVVLEVEDLGGFHWGWLARKLTSDLYRVPATRKLKLRDAQIRIWDTALRLLTSEVN